MRARRAPRCRNHVATSSRRRDSYEASQTCTSCGYLRPVDDSASVRSADEPMPYPKAWRHEFATAPLLLRNRSVAAVGDRIAAMCNDAPDDDAWERLALETRTRMAEYVEPFTTPVSGSENLVKGWLEGTGNYLRVEDEVYLATNEHVAASTQKMHLAHLPVRGNNYIRVTEPFTYWRWPVDFALSRLNVPVMPSESNVLSLAQFDERYSPVSGELLFWLGYPGSYATRTQEVTEINRRYSWFGELESLAVPV